MIERLDRGLIDFAVIVEPPNLSKYNYIEVPETNVWGLVMKKDDPLALKKKIEIQDIIGLPLICSAQAMKVDIPRWCGEYIDRLNLSGTINLAYNGSILVKEGAGYMLTFDKLIDTGMDSSLTFRQLYPTLETKMYIIWKKYQVFTPIAELLINEMKNELKQTQ